MTELRIKVATLLLVARCLLLGHNWDPWRGLCRRCGRRAW